MTRKRITRDFYSNCFFVALYLKIRFKNVEIRKVKNKFPELPHFYIVFNSNVNRRLHFKIITENACELFFKGYVEEIKWELAE